MATKKTVQEEEVTTQEELLFAGGPSIKQVDDWKASFGQVYMTEVDEEDAFIWRVLSRKEFKEIMKLADADAMYREERVCEKCIIWPEGYTFVTMGDGKAGVPTILAEQIMDKSGFTSKTGPIPL